MHVPQKIYKLKPLLIFVLGILVGCGVFFASSKSKPENHKKSSVRTTTPSPIPTPTTVPKRYQFFQTFTETESGVDTNQIVPPPFFNGEPTQISNITKEEKEKQISEITKEDEISESKLFNVIYLINKASKTKEKIFTKQVTAYKAILSPEDSSEVMTTPEDIKNNQGPTRKIHAYEITPNDQYVIITTEDEIFVYDTQNKSLNKVYDQNTPEHIFPQETKFKLGYDYCYRWPFVFSPDYKKMYVHKCMWEGSGIMVVDLQAKQVKDPEIPVGFGSKTFGWVENESILFYDMHTREIPGLYLYNTQTSSEELLLASEESVSGAAYIDGYIYFAISNSFSKWVHLYKLDLEEKVLYSIKQLYNEVIEDFTAFNIWKEGNNINWDYVQGGKIFRYTYPIN